MEDGVVLVCVRDSPVTPSGERAGLCSPGFPRTAGRVAGSAAAAAARQRCVGVYFAQRFVPPPHQHVSVN